MDEHDELEFEHTRKRFTLKFTRFQTSPHLTMPTKSFFLALVVSGVAHVSVGALRFILAMLGCALVRGPGGFMIEGPDALGNRYGWPGSSVNSTSCNLVIMNQFEVQHFLTHVFPFVYSA